MVLLMCGASGMAVEPVMETRRSRKPNNLGPPPCVAIILRPLASLAWAVARAYVPAMTDMTVAGPTGLTTTATPVTDRSARRAVAWWLLSVAALVALMVVVGGVTRLTESGLSIVYWKPVSGILPPLTAEAWQEEFALYRTSPEYMIVNTGMSLAEFKTIYWWEYGHRLLGRLIGVAFAVPLGIFALRRRVPAGYGLRLLGLLALGSFQGLLGWYMVQSGLVDEPEVSQYRLAAHFMLAMAIFSLLVWTALDLLSGRGAGDGPLAGRLAWGLLGLTVLQLTLGAFVAGMKAGLVYNSWPLMGSGILPPDLWQLEPLWLNLTENRVTVQFLHRMSGYALVLAALGAAVWLYSRGTPSRHLAAALAGACLVQMTLGIATLLAYVPVGLGAAHQAGGVAVLTLSVVFLHRARASGFQ